MAGPCAPALSGGLALSQQTANVVRPSQSQPCSSFQIHCAAMSTATHAMGNRALRRARNGTLVRLKACAHAPALTPTLCPLVLTNSLKPGPVLLLRGVPFGGVRSSAQELKLLTQYRVVLCGDFSHRCACAYAFVCVMPFSLAHHCFP